MQDHDPPRTLSFHPSARSIVYFGPFRLDLSDGLLSRDGEEVRLAPRAMTILQHLVERCGRIVSKQALMDFAWRDAHVSETSLTEAVGLIRQALGDDPQQPRFIQTVHRRGYRFIAPLATEAPSPAPPSSFAAPPVAASSAPPPASSPAPSSAPSPSPSAAPSPAPFSSLSPSPPSSIPPVVERVPPPDASVRTSDAVLAKKTAPAERTRRAVVRGLAAAAVLLAIVVPWAWIASRPTPPDQVIRVNVAFPAEQAPVPGLNTHPVVALSPDGRRLVYVGGAQGEGRLFLREMNRFDALPLPGTEGAHGPFFSPDGDWVAFFAKGSLKKVRVTANDREAAQTICATEPGVGGTWVSAQEIAFAPNWRGPLMRVSTSGGRPAAVTLPAGASYRWPDRLDDRTILATRWKSSADDAAVVAISLSSGAERVIAEPATFGRYAHDGYVLFLRDGDLFAVRVDPSAQRPQGTPVRVIPAIMTGMTGAAQFAVSPRGSLLYIDDMPERSLRTLARVDGRGAAVDLPVPPRDFRYVAACGGRLAATVFARGQTHLWTGHLDRAAMTQITREGAAFEPVWSPDCRTIAFSWNRTGVATIYAVAIESGDAPRVLFESPFASAPGSWTADGRWLAYTERHPETSADVWLWDGLTGHRRPVVAAPGLQLLPALSPDGKYVAYESSVTGMFEVEIASVRTGARTQVSVGGGAWPSWSADGRRLFFLRDTSIMRADVEWRDGQIVARDPIPLFTDPDIVLFRRAADDQFVWLRRTAGAVPLTRTNLVLNWFLELPRDTR